MESDLCFGAYCKMAPCSRLSLAFSAKLGMAGSPSVLKVTLAKPQRSMKPAMNSVAKG
jgi:hypothetical protein